MAPRKQAKTASATARAASRKASIAAKRAAAQAQADKDAMAKAESQPTGYYKLDPTRPATLHELNLQARSINKALNDTAREAADAAGKAAFEVLKGKKASPAAGVTARYRHVAKMQDQAARAMQRAEDSMTPKG